ncbi:MAG: PKD domain-containing protein [Bacteroidota bacterium]
MKRQVILTVIYCFCSLILFSQVTTTTISDGSYTDAINWDNGVPASADTAIIQHNMTLTSTKGAADFFVNSGGTMNISAGAKLTVFHLCQIDAGGSIINDDLFVCDGDYVLNGTHGGTAVIRLGVGGNISGTGSSTNTDKVSIVGGNRTILAGSDLDFTSLQFTLFDAVTVTNNGTLRTNFLKGQSTGETWEQGANSQLIVDYTNTSILLTASATGNLVSLNDATNTTTDVLVPTSSEYYDLEINGDGIKRLRGDIIILNDLSLNGSDFEVQRSGVIYDVTIQGDWTNNGGEFVPSAGNVSFTGVDQNITIATGNELFHNLNFFNTGTLTQNGNIAVINDLTFSSTYDLNGNSLTLLGDFTNSGSFTANNGSVTLSGFLNQDIDGSTVFYDLTINNTTGATLNTGTSEVFGTLTLNNGTFSTNNELIIGSDATNTGRIGPVTGGSISGNVTVERFFDPVFQGWHQLGVATNSNTLENWNDDFLTTGFTGSDFPSFPFNNIVSYDETVSGDKNEGLNGALDITDAIVIGSGRRVYLDNEPMEIETSGTVHTGDFSFTLTYTVDMGEADDGWNLVSNPYASAIDWDAGGWTKTNVNDAIYLWDGDLGLYNSYIGGVGTNGGSNIIPSSQAFWVQTNDAAPVMTVTETDKSTDDGTFKNSPSIDVLNLYVEDGSSQDQIALVFREDANLVFDHQYDAYKFYSENDIAQIASLTTDSIELSINSIPGLNSETSIPIAIRASEGDYSLATHDDFSLPETACSRIEDLFTGEIYQLGPNQSIEFNWSGDNRIYPRFLIHFSAIANLEVSPTLCYGAENGFAEVTGPQDGPWDYTWYDIDGNVLLEDFGTLESSSINDLPPGEYSVEIQHSGSCGNELMNFELSSFEETSFENLEVDVDQCNNSQNGQIEFTITNGDDASSWLAEVFDLNNDLVASQTVEQNQAIFEMLNGGEYLLKVSNECDLFEEIIDLTDLNATSAEFEANNTTINLALGELFMPSNNSINAEDFIWDFGDGTTSSVVNPVHEYSEIGTYNVQLIASNSNCEDEFTIEIEVIDEVIGIDELNPENFDVYLNENGQLLITNESFVKGPFQIEIRNIAGQLLYEKQFQELNGQIELESMTFTPSIYLVSLIKNDISLFNRKIKL